MRSRRDVTDAPITRTAYGPLSDADDLALLRALLKTYDVVLPPRRLGPPVPRGTLGAAEARQRPVGTGAASSSDSDRSNSAR